MKGGNHLLNKDDIFSFDLRESLYFEKGQEVSEMLNISLEPEISIQSFQDYVSIRGVIELQGEYLKSERTNGETEEPLDIHDNHSLRYLEKVEDKDDHHAAFSHRFPVEISVPSYRVTHMNDVSVSIETFDYEVPVDNQLIVTSTIEIYGIGNDERPEDISDKQGENEVIDEAIQDGERLFEFEFKKEADSDKLIATDSVTSSMQRGEIEEEPEAEEEKVEDDDGRWKYKQTQSFDDFFKAEDDENVIDVVSAKVDDSAQEDEEVAIVEDSVDVQEESSEVEAVHQEAVRDTNLLENLFGESDAEASEKYTQMRICIVQEQDTLETISERYEVPKLQLLKQNRLEDDHLSEGQLLSIPFKTED